MVRSQIGTLTPDPSLGHNLCFKYSNGMHELILDIYIPRYFLWHNFFFNPMNCDPYNHSLKIRESIESLTAKVGAHLGMCGFIPSHPLTLSGTWNVIPRLHLRPAPLQGFALVSSPRLRSWQKSSFFILILGSSNSIFNKTTKPIPKLVFFNKLQYFDQLLHKSTLSLVNINNIL